MMKISVFLLFFRVVSGAAMGNGGALRDRQEPVFDRKGYYHVLKAGGLIEIETELTLVAPLGRNDEAAYSGTLLMRKAGLLRRPKDKLDAFRSGRIKLETAIQADPGKVEYHFLRLIIQEHAPKVTKYKDKLSEDGELIRKHFSKLPPDLQEAIREYSQGSAVLHPADW